MRTLLCSVLLLFSVSAANAQMWNGVDTLYGNEWIDYSKPYFKIKVAEDGIYNIDYQTLASAGFPLSIAAVQWRMFRYGTQIPVFCTTNGLFGSSDYVQFYAEKNRGQVDFFLFEDAANEQVNERYSMFNDTAVYYLTWSDNGQGLRHVNQPNDLTNLPQKEAFCWSSVEQMPIAGAFKKKISEEITYSWFDGVGYTTSGSASENPVSFNLPGIISTGPAASMHVRYTANLEEHHKRILINDSLYAEDQFTNFKILDHQFDIPASELSPTTVLKITSPIGDRHGLAYATIRYARDFNFAGSHFSLFSLPASQTEQYIEIQGFNTSNGTPILYDLSNRKRYQAIIEGALLKIKISPGLTERQFMLLSPDAVKPVTTLQTVQFQNLNSGPVDYIILSNATLFKDAAGMDRVAEYAAYRSSMAGGSHSVKVVDVEDLYAQFSYGVRFHPIAIRNFLHWAKHQWPGLEHAFIIGKALDFQNFRTTAQQSTLIDSLFFVPNFSTPGSDLPFTMQGNHLSDPIMAIGRLAVTKPEEIHNYLQKVIQQEQQLGQADQTIASKAWMKRVIHNSGGLSGESASIRTYTSSMANTLAGSRFGADVHPFYKTSDDPIQLSAYEQLLDLMNDGVAVWTIFGHSSAFAVDFDIGLPESYDNFGRYPLMLVMGCFSGICSAPQQGIGEQFVLAPDRGAIAYIASVNYSFIDALHDYGQQFYQRMGGADYGKSIGLTLAHTIGDLKNTNSAGLKAVLHQNLMQGDPAIRVYAHQGPDYVIDQQSVQFAPNPVSINEAELKLRFDVVNIGENTGDQLAINITQRLPDNSTLIARLQDTIDAPGFRKTLDYQIPVTGSKIGFNRFFVALDPENKIAENPPAAEMNNSLNDALGNPGQDLFYYDNDVSPVYPPAFGVVGAYSPSLYASTLNSNAASLRYLFELDTVELFNSPQKVSAQITQKGGLIVWKPTMQWSDSVVYYWRVARDSLVNGQPLWRTRSFIYIKDSPPGWNQSHFGQFRENSFVNLKAVDSLRQIQFQDNAAFVNVQVAFRDVNRYPGFKNAYYQGFYGDYGFSQQGISRGVCMMVVDPNTGRAVINPANGPYNYNPPVDREFFWFDTRDSLQRIKMMDFVEQGIPDGYYVGLLALNAPSDAIGYAPQFWAKDSITQGRNLFQVLENQGARHVRSLSNFVTAPPAYGFVFRKNHPEFANLDTVVTNTNATVEIRASFLAKWALGFYESPVIGPVKAWKSLHWRRAAFDNASDEAAISVLAVREGLEDSLLFTLKTTQDTSLEHIPVTKFPLLKIRYDLVDTLLRTATPLQYVRIVYDAVPEGALDPLAHFDFYGDTIQQGDTFKSSIAFANISEVSFDSVLVRLKVENQQNNGFELKKRLGKIPAGDSLHVDFSALTRLLSGPQRMVLEVNPFNDQQELYHFNNVLLRNFYVSRDVRNPLLDVTFDGQHILDGDLISPNPVVMISLKDENRFLAMRDSNTIALRLQKPDGTQQNIPVNDPSVQFFPADPTNVSKKNQARLEWRPNFLIDGEYRLLVNGTDASGNESSSLDWSVSFNIITKSSLSSFLNYPNPFSTSTCFVYTLTGAEAPTNFRIQIMTVAGRVVREITEREFGPLKPGAHRSDFCWDGKDEYGDQLANGVYLYRIVAKKADGSDFEHFENQSVDGFFKHGFGKMVLMR